MTGDLVLLLGCEHVSTHAYQAVAHLHALGFVSSRPLVGIAECTHPRQTRHVFIAEIFIAERRESKYDDKMA